MAESAEEDSASVSVLVSVSGNSLVYWHPELVKKTNSVRNKARVFTVLCFIILYVLVKFD
jgi:hypothetical protein